MAVVQEQITQRLSRILLPAFVFGASFVLYTLTLCPTVYVGDSAEFITNAVTLGINHPTGYPLYTILTRLWLMVVPFGMPAYAVNAFSALAASGAVVCMYFILEFLTARRAIALLGALLLTVSSTLWSRATSAEVYSLSSFFFALTTLIILKWYRDRQLIQLALAAYVAGLGLSQHSTGVLAGVCFVLFVLLSEPGLIRNTRTLIVLTVVFLIGLSSYLYLPIRTIAGPPIAWGDMRTMEGVFRHLLPVGEKGLAPYFGGNTGTRLSWFLHQALTREFWFFGAISVFGVLALMKRWRLLVLFTSIVIVNVMFAVSRKMPLHADFDANFIPTYFVMAILIGVGLVRLQEFAEKRWRKLPPRFIQLSLSTALLLMLLTTAYANYRQNNRSQNFFGHDFGYNLYQPIEQNAIVFTIGDEQTFLGWYLKYVEKLRPSISFIDTRLLGTAWGIRLFDRELRLSLRESDPPDRVAAEIIRSAINKRPIYFTHRLPWRFLSTEFEMLPLGMLIQILPKGSALDYRPVDFKFHPGWDARYMDDRCRLLVDFYPKEYIDHAQFWLNHQKEPAAQEELNHFFSFPYRKSATDNANAFLMQSLISYRRGEAAKARDYADSALALSPADWRALEYRGNFRVQQKDTAGAVADWESSLRLNPNNANVRQNLEGLLKDRRPTVRR
jgi:tetratricopeptide (TPR) repeat protein